MSVAKHRPEDYGIRFIRAREPVEAGRAGGEEAAQTTHNGPTKWKWAPVNLNDPLDYVTGRSVMALAAPNLGEKSCWYSECRNATGAPMETAMCGPWTEGAQITGKILATGLLTDIREGLRNAGHPEGRRTTAIAGATHVRAVLEMAWQHALEEALEGAAEKVDNILDRRKLQRWAEPGRTRAGGEDREKNARALHHGTMAQDVGAVAETRSRNRRTSTELTSPPPRPIRTVP